MASCASACFWCTTYPSSPSSSPAAHIFRELMQCQCRKGAPTEPTEQTANAPQTAICRCFRCGMVYGRQPQRWLRLMFEFEKMEFTCLAVGRIFGALKRNSPAERRRWTVFVSICGRIESRVNVDNCVVALKTPPKHTTISTVPIRTQTQHACGLSRLGRFISVDRKNEIESKIKPYFCVTLNSGKRAQ